MTEQNYPHPTVGALIFNPEGKMLLVQSHKFHGKWVVPGGHIEVGERMADAVIREAKEETGLDIELTGLFGVYSDPKRDPRGHTCSIVWIAKAIGGELRAETDAADVIVTKDYLDLQYAFDHRQMIEDYEKGKN